MQGIPLKNNRGYKSLTLNCIGYEQVNKMFFMSFLYD